MHAATLLSPHPVDNEMNTQDKFIEALREPAEKLAQALENDCSRIGGDWQTVITAAAKCIRGLLQAHDADAAQAQKCEHLWVTDGVHPTRCSRCGADPLKEAMLTAAPQPHAQAQSCEWVMVPHEPTSTMMDAASRMAVAANVSVSRNLICAVYQTMLVAAPPQAAEPVAWKNPAPHASAPRSPSIGATYYVRHPDDNYSADTAMAKESGR